VKEYWAAQINPGLDVEVNPPISFVNNNYTKYLFKQEDPISSLLSNPKAGLLMPASRAEAQSGKERKSLFEGF
jgi:hypothetical protein